MDIAFRELTVDDAEMVGLWRTSKRVTEFLFTDIEFNLENQKKWVESCFHRPDYYHWLITVDDRPVGHLQLAAINPETKTAEWGYFLGDEEVMAVGGMVPAMLYSWCFKHLGLEHMVSEIMHTNTRVIAMHQALGSKFTPEHDHVITKNGREYLVVTMSLAKADFIGGRFDRYDVVLPTEKWTASPFAN